MNRSSICFVLVSVVAILASVATAPDANAQCSTCASPTVAYYQPTVAYQPVATQQVRTGWYPGRWFDRRRMRRWGVTTAAAAPAYTAAYAPYTAAYTPYTAAYAYTPTSYTAAYRPYVTAYAPLASTSYTVARPVALSPVVSSCGTCGCDPCSCSPCGCAQPACGGCGSCSSCSSGVSQAVYGAPSTGCSSCAGGSGTPIYSDSSSSAPPTPQPALDPSERIPASSNYPSESENSSGTSDDPSPVTDSNTYLEPPKLFSPRDRSANRPTVEVRNAVYRQPVTNHATSYAPARELEVDEHGWSAVSTER